MLEKSEEQRISICFGIIATSLALFVVVPSGYWSIITGIFAISGVLAFVYILITAAKLKYRDPLGVGIIDVPESIRKMAYDVSIDVYGSNFFIIIVITIGYFFNTNKPETFLDLGLSYFLVGILIWIALLIIMAIIANKEKDVKK